MAIQYHRDVLPNGLTLLAETDPSAATAAVGFFVRTGTRDERPEEMGVSHFLEHMVFKGSERRGPVETSEELDDLGLEHNAFTSHEMTVYYASGLPESILQGAEVLADILRPALREADFEEERGVILEEIAMYADQPYWVLMEEAGERYFRNHPLGFRVLGTTETISKLPVEAMRRYFALRYASDSVAVAAAGNVDFAEFRERVAAACSSWSPSGAKREHPALAPGSGDFTLRRPELAAAYGVMQMPAVDLLDPRRYEASLVAQILGDSEGSRLFWSLVETGLAEQADASFDPRDGVGEMSVHWVCDPEAHEEVEAVVRRELAAFSESLTDEDLVRSRAKVATSVTLAGERPSGRMHRLGANWTVGREYATLEEELARIERVTLRSLHEYLEAFPLVPRMTGRLLPEA
ncbi:MAG: Protease 3 precursor, partial [Planctomycetota bacterium]